MNELEVRETPQSNEPGMECQPNFKQRLLKYIKGNSHVHTRESNIGDMNDAMYDYEQIYNYGKEIVNSGNTMEFIILTEHPSHAGHPELVTGENLIHHKELVHQFMEGKGESGDPKLLCGVEANIISAEGDLDVPDDVLAQMDIVIASKHDMRQVFPEQNGDPNAEQLTHIYLALMDNSHVDVIGHPNRFINEKMLKEMNWSAIFIKAKETNTALEINFKAPMPPFLIQEMVKAGTPIFISTDTHSLEEYQSLPDDVEIKTDDDRLNQPLGVKFSFWRRKVLPAIKALESANANPGQVITSSYERLNKWLSKEKSERKIEIAKE